MEYKTVAEARQLGGLRLVLTAGVPGPWSEAAKALFRVKQIPYVAVLQKAAAENEELVQWTGHRNAPTAMYEDEPPRVTWMDLLNLAERLQPEPALVPADIDDRILMTGLINEIAGEGGMMWQARYLMLRGMEQAMGEEAAAKNPMFSDYRYSRETAAAAPARIIPVLQRLERQLDAQFAADRRYFLADSLSALDLYWACFSQFLDPLPEEVNPMPSYLRRSWEGAGAVLAEHGYAPRECLLQHRDFIFNEHIGLPLDF